MLKLTLLVMLMAGGVYAQTNVLQLTWNQPVGWHSQLYSSTSLNGNWSLLSTNGPDYSLVATQEVAFFTVVVSPAPRNGASLYEFDPNVEGIIPEYTNEASVAYSSDGAGPFYGWSVTNQMWQ